MKYENFKISLKNFIKESENLDKDDKFLKLENVILESYLKGDIPLEFKDLWMWVMGEPVHGAKEALLDMILVNPDICVEGYELMYQEFLKENNLEFLKENSKYLV